MKAFLLHVRAANTSVCLVSCVAFFSGNSDFIVGDRSGMNRLSFLS